MSTKTGKGRRVKSHRWYFGGLASAGAQLFTHPLDLLKVGRSNGHGSVMLISAEYSHHAIVGAAADSAGGV